MSPDQIITGQKVNPDKKELARKFRREMTPEEQILWRYLRNGALGFKLKRRFIMTYITLYPKSKEHA